MHIEPGVVSSAKIGMGYTTAAVAFALTAHRARQGARSNGGWLPLLLLFGAGATAIGLATGLLAQGLFFAPADLPQYGMNVSTLLLPLYGVRLLARRIIPAHDVRSEPVELARFDRPTPGLPSTEFPSPRAGPQDAPPCFGAAPRPENRMRTANVNVQAVLAQAQTKLSGTPQQTPSSDGTSDTEKVGKLYPALAGVHQRIATQSQTASASLSALGKFKSDLFNLGTAAKNLASLPATSTPQAIQSGLQQLVSAYNAA